MRRARITSCVAALVLAASLLASCSSARSDLGSTSGSSCYQAVPTAARAVGGHGHLEGVRKYTLNGLRAVAPRLYKHLADDLSKKQGVCVAGYTGHFTAAEVEKPLGRSTGTLAVAVVTTPGNTLLGTLILTKLPVRFQQTHPF
ncbi:MAG TPA: hypothetical protein VH012_05510 [Acidimicrobiales bacterium]|nr:hypothetical protein [Acidimicrobiales bacterium]